MFDSGNNTPEGFMLPEDTLSFDGQSSMLHQLDHVDITAFDGQLLSPFVSRESQNNEVTPTPTSDSVPCPGWGPGPASGSSSDSTASITVAVRRNKPTPRKGHTKSRRGCYTCKRRKVKCSETLPECDNCTRIGLICEYPKPPNPSALSRLANSRQRQQEQQRRAQQADIQILQPNPTIISPSSTPMFTMQDLRFFHHFLIAAHPPLPAQADGLWNNVAALSHNYDYLVHAMLGLAASHLSLLTSSTTSSHQLESQTAALSHRIKAISLLNQSLSFPCSSSAEGDARFASILILAFQASCLPDGMTEFLSMIRLCSAIADSGENSIFRDLAKRGYSDSMRKMTAKTKAEVERKGLEREQERLVDEFLRSLGRLRVGILGMEMGMEMGEVGDEKGNLVQEELEEGKGLQLLVLEGMEGAARTSKVSPAQAFQELTNLYSPMINAPDADFASLTDPANHYAQILLLHFFLMEFSLGELSLGSFRPRFAFRRKVCFAWLNEVARRLPRTTEYAELMEWPLELGQIVFTQREPT